MKKIYMDHNATTPLHPEALDAMLPFLKDNFGNPSSIHWAGRGVKKYIDEAREKVASLLNADPSEIVFTGGGSEGDNLAIKGVANVLKKKSNHIITTQVEHPAVLTTCQYMEKRGCKVTYLPVDHDGVIDLDDLRDSITKKTVLISIMYANNETGTLFPVKEAGEIAADNGIIFHTDAVQAVGKIPIDTKDMKVNLLSLSGHKLYGPKGIGCLYVKKGTPLVPLIHGGHQEGGRRAGTENIPGIVGLGKACEIVNRDMESQSKHITKLRDRLYKGIIDKLDHVKLNGHTINRIPNTLNLSFEFIEGESLLLNLDLEGIAVSSGSACTSGSLKPSHVLTAMDITPEIAQGSLRFSLGLGNTEEDVEYVLGVLPEIVNRLRSMSPLYLKKVKQR
ncbi:MAG: cysteine desulfurase NifS [Deltaproteobacteria bacterium CG12_big_fil_rev_8_21_14_0_65_43_10]|nr:MAG: cysteine desulfurase NifS [Deltaproteobacteria bacterium CG2_30_43_15]PIQ45106.1 MAG: cysteine desulfurase NifS [Deltaproteobacteria bacterium CG12_big_fil_rev_8_21_14_0_65_43_10]PIU84873.1 MAG: cysteine desulfurase NifS [Deltaproteobacteria bacterium CG06_land_8_20_14_3_00_44_19]PIX23570.1 MAG: cysteine desulfurase NifS [Deltaproteobacteria bacterium CG_4_8_14_3_um_filter_43_13]PIZ20740.1 MAG: cysteine desulfurase NifS [Deltaproteobacteria bacterium CG_4_10_14_0_8_um_filter_43_12]PJB4